MDWLNQIVTEDCGMCNSHSYYDIEELYQAFKERFMKELLDDVNEMENESCK